MKAPREKTYLHLMTQEEEAQYKKALMQVHRMIALGRPTLGPEWLSQSEHRGTFGPLKRCFYASLFLFHCLAYGTETAVDKMTTGGWFPLCVKALKEVNTQQSREIAHQIEEYYNLHDRGQKLIHAMEDQSIWADLYHQLDPVTIAEARVFSTLHE